MGKKFNNEIKNENCNFFFFIDFCTNTYYYFLRSQLDCYSDFYIIICRLSYNVIWAISFKIFCLILTYLAENDYLYDNHTIANLSGYP